MIIVNVILENPYIHCKLGLSERSYFPAKK